MITKTSLEEQRRIKQVRSDLFDDYFFRGMDCEEFWEKSSAIVSFEFGETSLSTLENTFHKFEEKENVDK